MERDGIDTQFTVTGGKAQGKGSLAIYRQRGIEIRNTQAIYRHGGPHTEHAATVHSFYAHGCAPDR